MSEGMGRGRRAGPPKQGQLSTGRKLHEASERGRPLHTSRGRGTGFAGPQAQRPPRGGRELREANERGGHIPLCYNLRSNRLSGA